MKAGMLAMDEVWYEEGGCCLRGFGSWDSRRENPGVIFNGQGSEARCRRQDGEDDEHNDEERAVNFFKRGRGLLWWSRGALHALSGRPPAGPRPQAALVIRNCSIRANRTRKPPVYGACDALWARKKDGEHQLRHRRHEDCRLQAATGTDHDIDAMPFAMVGAMAVTQADWLVDRSPELAAGRWDLFCLTIGSDSNAWEPPSRR